MISEVVAYAASRATNGAVENISRRAAWLAAGSIVLLFGLFFVVLAAFWTIEPIYGPVQTAALIATVCLVVALLCFVVPSALQFLQRQRVIAKSKETDPMTETIDAVNVEAAEAVDYFGPLKVMASAFMLGFGAAKQLRR
jgi:hypothetical protein